MSLPIPLPEFLQGWTAAQWVPLLLLLLAIFVWRRAGFIFARLEAQNRKLRRAIRGYERMEQEHVELSRENRERNAFHAELGPLITRINLERTARGVADLI